LVQTSQAAIDTAKLNINYCTIRAPIDGRVGLRQVDVGNYVVPGDANGIVVLTQTNPITVIFTLPEDEVGNIAARLRVTGKLPAEIYNRGLTEKIATGTLTTIDNQIDATTGTFKLRAEFANNEDRLFPNQFVNVRVLLDTLHNTVVIPTSAIERGQQGAFVYVVEDDNTVHARTVTLGPTEGERVAVSSGLEIGAKIVVDGADKLKEGMHVILPTEKSGASARRKS
jgi:multidrug efflux system membrane fusion protein